MRVAGDHLVGDGFDHIGKGEIPGLLGHPGVVDGLEQEVAKLPFQLWPGLAVDGIGDLEGFLQRVGGDAGEVLLDIPGAAGFRVAQAGHDGEEAFDAGGGKGGGHGASRSGAGPA